MATCSTQNLQWPASEIFTCLFQLFLNYIEWLNDCEKRKLLMKFCNVLSSVSDIWAVCILTKKHIHRCCAFSVQILALPFNIKSASSDLSFLTGEVEIIIMCIWLSVWYSRVTLPCYISIPHECGFKLCTCSLLLYLGKQHKWPKGLGPWKLHGPPRWIPNSWLQSGGALALWPLGS